MLSKIYCPGPKPLLPKYVTARAPNNQFVYIYTIGARRGGKLGYIKNMF